MEKNGERERERKRERERGERGMDQLLVHVW